MHESSIHTHTRLDSTRLDWYTGQCSLSPSQCSFPFPLLFPAFPAPPRFSNLISHMNSLISSKMAQRVPLIASLQPTSPQSNGSPSKAYLSMVNAGRLDPLIPIAPIAPIASTDPFSICAMLFGAI